MIMIFFDKNGNKRTNGKSYMYVMLCTTKIIEFQTVDEKLLLGQMGWDKTPY